MTTKKKVDGNAVEINLDQLIDEFGAFQERYETQGIEIETLQVEQGETRMELTERAKQLKVISVFANPEQQKRIEELHLEMLVREKPVPVRTRGRGNATCTIVLDILENHVGEITNEQLHHAYIDSLDEDETGLNYTQFNIAIRPLTNNDKVVTRTFVEKGNSRTALMSLTTAQE